MRSTTGMAGSSFTVQSEGKSYFVSQSIGQESVTGTYTQNNRTVRQGFQQPLYGIVATGEISGVLDAVIYPNPTENSLKIDIRDQLSSDVQVYLIDLSGRLVLEDGDSGTHNIELNLSEISPGAYQLKVVTGDKQLISSVIKH